MMGFLKSADLNRTARTEQRVDGWLAALSTGEDFQPDVRTALARLRSRADMGPASQSVWRLPASRYVSVGVHAGFFALLMFGASSPSLQQTIREKISLIDPNLTAYVPKPEKGGGGGGAREPLPASKGELPKPSAKAFVPPRIVPNTPKLAMEPSIVSPPDVQSLPADNWGDPLASMMTGANGNGSGGGMGSGGGGGLGPGQGTGYGPGAGSAYGGDIFRPGNGVSMPVVVFKVEPEYSEDARKSKYSGVVVLSVVVDKDGRTRDLHVIRSLGMGLDEKAVEAVQQWRFRPGMKGGQAVNVRAQVEVSFRLL